MSVQILDDIFLKFQIEFFLSFLSLSKTKIMQESRNPSAKIMQNSFKYRACWNCRGGNALVRSRSNLNVKQFAGNL